MKSLLEHRTVYRLAIALTGCTVFLTGCNDTIRGTVEDGVISVSTSLFAALFQAIQDVIAAS